MNFSKLIQSPKSCDLKSNRSLLQLSSTSSSTIMHHASWTIFNQPPMTCPSITSMAATTRGNDSHPNDGDGLKTHPGMFFFYFVFFSTNSLKVDYVYGTSNDNEVITTTITATNTWNGEQGLKMLMRLERQVCFFHLFFFSSTNYL